MKQKESLADLYTNILIGAGDGVLLPLALSFGMTAAGMMPAAIFRYGMGITSFAALLFGIGGYLTRKHAALQPKNFLRDEMNAKGGGRSKTELRIFFADLGMDPEMQEQAIREMEKDDVQWNQFKARYPETILNSNPRGSVWAGITIAGAFTLAGTLVLLPYRFTGSTTQAMMLAGICALLLLSIAGSWKARLIGHSPWIGAGRLIITAALLAAAAYGMAGLFNKW